MQYQNKILLLSFVATVVLSLIIVPILRRLKVGQIERKEGPESHLKKQGTPTMGGIIMIIVLIVVGAFLYIDFSKDQQNVANAILPLIGVAVGFGLIGFVDDSKKLFFKNTKGLSPKAKMLGLLIVAVAKRDDIIQRILYYWARTYVRNIHKNEEYKTLNKTIGIIITDFKINELKSLGYFTKWKIIETNERKVILTDYFELDIIEIPKIYDNITNKSDKLLDWICFLDNPTSGKVEDIMESNEGIRKAKEKLEELSDDEIMQRLAEWKEAAEHDEASARGTAMREGIAKEKKEIASKMLEKGIKIELIKEITGLTDKELTELINK